MHLEIQLKEVFLILNWYFFNLFSKDLQRQMLYLFSFKESQYFPCLSKGWIFFASLENSYQSGWGNNISSIDRWQQGKKGWEYTEAGQNSKQAVKWLGKSMVMKYCKEKIYWHNELHTVALFNTLQPLYFCHKCCFLHGSWEYYTSLPLLLGICKIFSWLLWKAGTYAENHK